jgi:hypothetical protein
MKNGNNNSRKSEIIAKIRDKKFTAPFQLPKSAIQENKLNLVKIRVTPEIAENILNLNKKNRTIKETNLNLIMRQIERGEWDSENGEVISITKDWILSNGQHRLQAIINTGISTDIYFLFGVSKNAIFTVDTGSNRTAKDLLTIEGFKYPDKIGGYIKLKQGLSEGNNRLHARKNMSNQEVLKIAKANEQYIYDIINRSLQFYNKCGYISPNDYTTFYDMFREVSEVDAEEFFDYFTNGAQYLDKHHPISKLNSILHKDKKSLGKKFSSAEKRAMIVIAWNNFYTGKHYVKNLRWDNRKEFPKIKGLDYSIFETRGLFPNPVEA